MFAMYLETNSRHSGNPISEEVLMDFLSENLSSLQRETECPDFKINVSSGTTLTVNSRETFFKLEFTYNDHNGYYDFDDTTNFLKRIKDEIHWNFESLDDQLCTCIFIDTTSIF